MRIFQTDFYRTVVTTAFFAVSLFTSPAAFAQTEENQDESADIQSVENLLEKNMSFSAPEVEARPKTLSAPKKVNYKDSEIVADYQDFAIIQRKYMPKTKRFALTLGGLLVPTDVYFRTMGLSSKLNYHFSEDWGVELYGSFLTSAARSEVKDLEEKQAMQVQSAISLQSAYGINAYYSSIYGKTSVFNRKIVPFEIYQTIGIGKIRDKSGGEPLSIQVGIGELFSLSRSSAFRADLMWAFYKGTTITGAEQSANSIFLSFNYTFFLGEPDYR